MIGIVIFTNKPFKQAKAGKQVTENRVEVVKQSADAEVETDQQVSERYVGSEAEKRRRTDRYNAEASRSLRFNQAEAKLANDPLDRAQLSEHALLLDDPDAEEASVKNALHILLSAIRFLGKEKSYPTGLNVEITNALLGVNSRKVAYLPMDSPRINENGELVDEYGIPYWFHSQASNDLTITSAGPDKVMHTSDDIRYPSE